MNKTMRKGQTMVEYIIIVALVAIAGIAVWKFFSRGVAEKVAGATSALSAEEGDKAKAAKDAIGDETIRELGRD